MTVTKAGWDFTLAKGRPEFLFRAVKLATVGAAAAAVAGQVVFRI
jgi:hypothetical protein